MIYNRGIIPKNLDIKNMFSTTLFMGALRSFSALFVFIMASPLVHAQTQEVTLAPIHDAFLETENETTVLLNEETLRVEAGSRLRNAYLMFDLSSVSGTITNIQLELKVYTDAGDGTINIYKGLSDNWTEDNLSNSNKPSTSGTPLGTFTGIHADGDLKTTTIDPNVLTGNLLSLVIEHTTASDVAFASSGPETSSSIVLAPVSDQPKLRVTYSTGSSTDTQSPTAPTLSNTGQTDTTADLSWSGATDDTGVTNYKIFKDGVLEATLGNAGTYQVTGLTASTTYSFTVTALDAAGNESVASNSVPVTTNAPSGGGSSVWSESNSVASYTGDVGIGTSTIPLGYKLAVNGKIITEELKVQLQSAWPDYVFAKNYDLPSLEEIQKDIDEKGHLPNMPSAKEVKENGLEVGEMNRLLLEKIEELTLYIIKQQKVIANQDTRISRLEKNEK